MLARREVLQKCLALGSIVIASDFSADSMLFAFQEGEKPLPKPTPPNPLGPFGGSFSPVNNILRAPEVPVARSYIFRDEIRHARRRRALGHSQRISTGTSTTAGLYDVDCDGYRYRGKLDGHRYDRTAYSFESGDSGPLSR